MQLDFAAAERFAHVMSSAEYFEIVDAQIAHEEDEYADAHEEPDPDRDLDDALRGKW